MLCHALLHSWLVLDLVCAILLVFVKNSSVSFLVRSIIVVDVPRQLGSRVGVLNVRPPAPQGWFQVYFWVSGIENGEGKFLEIGPPKTYKGCSGSDLRLLS